MNLKLKLIIMNFLQFAVWGSYLTSMGGYLYSEGYQHLIGWFYAMQGVVSIFMPAIMGIIADKWVPAQRLLGFCHALAALFIAGAGYFGFSHQLTPMFVMYSLSVAFYMPTLALSNSVAYTALEKGGYDTIKAFPPIRVFGTVGFIVAMLVCDFAGFQANYMQFYQCAVIGFTLALYAQILPHCPVSNSSGSKSLVQRMGLDAFKLFKSKQMALFFIFSMLLGVSLQITNGFANGFITSFKNLPEFANTFGANHANALISLSQVSETLCILLIPFFLKRFGIKNVMLIAMFAWVLRFGLFGLGNPGAGLWMFILSMIVYGVAFDFFNISGSLYVNDNTSGEMRSSAQGLFMIMTNGIGATIGTLGAQAIVNRFVPATIENAEKVVTNGAAVAEGWSHTWLIFAGYALVVAVLFAVLFRYKHQPEVK
ncbi:MAG: MFS transporter [Rikenellaceae bacterium]|nr:MFS transporter [Rikenellaceae bacterium]